MSTFSPKDRAPSRDEPRFDSQASLQSSGDTDRFGGTANTPLAPARPGTQEPTPASIEQRAGDRGDTERLTNLRHTLRTPLNQIIGYCELLQEEILEIGHAEFIPDLDRIHTAGRQLLGQVRSRLDPARVQDGAIDLAPLMDEMRAPLNDIMGCSELLQQQGAAVLSTTILGDLKKIGRAAATLLEFLVRGPEEHPAPEPHQEGSPPSSLPALVAVRPPREPRAAPEVPWRILVVDDNEMNRDMLSRRLERQGYEVALANNGHHALQLLHAHSYDLVLLDILMPELDGMETLARIKSDELLRHIPVIMLSAVDEVDSVVRCLEMGAVDYLPKPFNPVILRARITASLEAKHSRDEEQAAKEQLLIERDKIDELLLRILPRTIKERLQNGERTIADLFPEATVLFADLVDFTRVASTITPSEIVHLLGEVFKAWDWQVGLLRLEKIKTIGDSYMAAGGLPIARADHAAAVAELALGMRKVLKKFSTSSGHVFQVRIGICTGPVVAGVIGENRFIYDLWGDTVNLASRMESQGRPDYIQVSESTYERLKDKYTFDKPEPSDIKGKGTLNTYYLIDHRVAH